MACIPLRRSALRLVLVLAFAGPVPGAAPARAAEGGGGQTWYAEAFTQSEAGVRVTHHWSKGRKMRAELILDGIPIVFLVNGSTYYAIDALHGRALAVERSPKALAQDAKGGRPFLNEGQRAIESGAEKMDTERVAGRALDVYRLSNEPIKKTVWVTQDELRLPVKLEIFDRRSGQSATTQIDWLRDFEIPDAFFEPDPRVQVERMSYDEYVKRSREGPVGPVPALFSDALHGS